MIECNDLRSADIRVTLSDDLSIRNWPSGSCNGHCRSYYMHRGLGSGDVPFWITSATTLSTNLLQRLLGGEIVNGSNLLHFQDSAEVSPFRSTELEIVVELSKVRGPPNKQLQEYLLLLHIGKFEVVMTLSVYRKRWKIFDVHDRLSRRVCKEGGNSKDPLVDVRGQQYSQRRCTQGNKGFPLHSRCIKASFNAHSLDATPENTIRLTRII